MELLKAILGLVVGVGIFSLVLAAIPLAIGRMFLTDDDGK